MLFRYEPHGAEQHPAASDGWDGLPGHDLHEWLECLDVELRWDVLHGEERRAASGN